jgi:hypothetical protein
MIKILLPFLFSLSCFAAGPIVVGNGTGESEFSLALAQTQLKFFWNLCQQDPACRAAADSVPDLANAFQIIEASQLEFEKNSAPDAARMDAANRIIIFNQNLLWTAEGQAFSFIDSMSLYLQLMRRDLGVGSDAFQNAFLQLATNHLRHITIPIDVHSTLKVTNIRNGSVILMMEKDGALTDMQSLQLQSRIMCPNGQIAEDLKLGNLSYGYHVDHIQDSDFYFNSHIQYRCEKVPYKAHIIFGFKIFNDFSKMNLENLIFQINSIEVDN